MKSFSETEFVIFDVETTGLSPHTGDRIIEIAALKIKGMKAVERFETFVDPQREISWGAFMVNGISPQMLEGAPKAGEILPSFLDFLGESCLVGHNVKFDLGFLQQEVRLAGQALSVRHALDTVKMARRLLPELGRYSLANVAYALGLEQEQKHRAMSDVELTFDVFKQLLSIAERKDIENMKKLIDLCGFHLPVYLEKKSV